MRASQLAATAAATSSVSQTVAESPKVVENIRPAREKSDEEEEENET